MIHKFSIIIVLCFFSFKAMPQDSKYEIDRVMEEYFSILKTEGYTPSYDDDDDITFKVEGYRYYIMRRDYTEQFSLTRILTHEHGCDVNIYAAASYATSSARYAKATFNEGCTRVLIKSNLVNNGKDTKEIVTTGIKAVKYCSAALKEKYSELTE
jgi:hypothetical protein